VESLVPLSSNYDYTIRRKNSQYEFIFENIDLPFQDGGNDGYLIYKIKLRNDLSVGATFTNQADIYFDFNFPIVTNIESTTIEVLSNPGFALQQVVVSPNPTTGLVAIQTADQFYYRVEVFDGIGKKLATFINQDQIDISAF